MSLIVTSKVVRLEAKKWKKTHLPTFKLAVNGAVTEETVVPILVVKGR